jgi:hypothetical protein
MKKMLDLQIKEKAKMQNHSKEFDQKFVYQLKNNMLNYEMEKQLNGLKIKEQRDNYKKQLDDQLKEKTEHKKVFMDNVEKGINRDIINEIKYSKK